MSALVDWDALRARSLLPGGFGDDRAEIWPKLLDATQTEDISKEPCTEPHSDERQIGLDTQRSFVFYPVDDPRGRERLQTELHTLLVQVFRQHPHLSYFQGYHDIITVLFLTLPPELHLRCSVQLSLQRLRDSMGSTLNPVLGLLRVLNNVLHVADPSLAELLGRNTPLPYFALSNLLTLFSHDMPTLALIQHVFDYVLSRPPIIIVYLAAAIALSRKQEIKRLEEEDEEGMVHSLLSGLPDITDDVVDKSQMVEPDNVLMVPFALEALQVVKLEDPEPTVNPGVEVRLKEEDDTNLLAKSEQEDLSLDATVVSTLLDGDENTIINQTYEEGESPLVLPKTLEAEENDNLTEKIGSDDFSPPSLFDEKTSPSQLPTSPLSPPIAPPRPSTPPPQRPRISLSSLLIHADDLYESYPPKHPAISVSTIMGPKSVVFTWSETPSSMPTSVEAEAIVDRPELVVLPEPEQDLENEKGSAKQRRKRRKLHKANRFGRLVVERRTMVAGAVLVLGVAMAVYGIRGGVVVDGHHATAKTWKKVGNWFRVLVTS